MDAEVDELLVLVGWLTERLSPVRDRAALVRAVEEAPAGPPIERLRAVLPRVGLKGDVIRGDRARVEAGARADLPLVGLGPEGFSILDRAGFGFVRERWPAADRAPSWRRVRAGNEGEWLRVSAELPASALSPGGPGASPVRRVTSLLASERQDIAVVFVHSVGVGLLALATPLTIQVLVGWLAFGALVQPLLAVSVGLFACLIAAAALRSNQRYVVEILQRRVFVRTVTDLAARLPGVRADSFDRTTGPELANRFFDVLTLQKAIATLLLDGLAAALQATVGLALLAAYHPVLLVFDVVVVGLSAAVLLPFAKAAVKSAVVESKKKYEIAAWIDELTRHPLVFKLGGRGLAIGRADDLSRAWLEARASHFSQFFRQFVGMQAIQASVAVGLLFTCGWLVREGELTLGQLVAAEFVVTAALTGLAKFTDKLETVYDLLAGVDKLGSLIDLPRDGSAGLPPSGASAGVALSVSAEVLGVDADLQVEAGAKLGLLAPDAGRSAVAEVLVGVRSAAQGVVRRDGLPAAAWWPRGQFEEVCLVRPEDRVRGSIADNLTLGRRIGEEGLWRALAAVGLADRVGGVSEGLHGDPALSVEQGRALLVARALVSGARLIVVDGVFDGIPADRSAVWARALDALPATVIVVSSDPAVAARSGRVVHLANVVPVHPEPKV